MTHAAHNPDPRPPAPGRRGSAAGFTLVELLVAISIIVLLLGLALPAFRVITGGRSEAGATNQVAAMLGRARADAVGLQLPRGVAFYTDPAGQSRMAEVGPVVYPAWAGNLVAYPKGTYVSETVLVGVTPQTGYYVARQAVPANVGAAADPPAPTSGASDTMYWHIFVDQSNNPTPGVTSMPADAYHTSDPYFAAAGLFYDQLPDTDPVALPLGVGAQVIADNSAGTSGSPAVRTTDGYLHAGIVLFDAAGRLAYRSFVVSQYGLIGTAVKLTNIGTMYNNLAINNTNAIFLPSGYTVGPQPLPSSFGLVLYDRDAFANQNFPATDPTFVNTGTGATYGTAGSSPPAEADEETWLDVNATPLLINRYNGTLIRAE